MTTAEYLEWLASPSARRCVLVEVVARVAGVETTQYLSNLSYISDSGSTPANQAYTACLQGGVTSNAKLDLTGSQVSMSTGDLEIDNTGGVRDDWLAYIWPGRQITIYMGDSQWVKSDFRIIFDGIVDDLDSRNSETLNLRLRDKMERMNSPVTETVLGGVSDNKDRVLPVCFGECFNITPLLSDPALLRYLVHDLAYEPSRVERFIEVRSNGAVPVDYTGSTVNGYFTLNVAPAGTDITASVQGGRSATSSYSKDVSNIVQRIATKYGPATTRFSNSDLDLTSLAAFVTAHPQTVGLYASDRINRIDAFRQLASSVGAEVYMTSTGLLRLVQIALPSVQTTASGSAWEITAEDITYHSLQIAERVPVKGAIKLGYCKNWTPQTNIAAGVNPISVPLFTEEWMTVSVEDSTVTGYYRQTVQPEREDTLLVAEADATAEANRRLTLWKTQRYVYEMECRAHFLLAELGDPVTLTHDRFGLSGGVTGMIVSISRDWMRGRVKLGVLA